MTTETIEKPLLTMQLNYLKDANGKDRLVLVAIKDGKTLGCELRKNQKSIDYSYILNQFDKLSQ